MASYTRKLVACVHASTKSEKDTLNRMNDGNFRYTSLIHKEARIKNPSHWGQYAGLSASVNIVFHNFRQNQKGSPTTFKIPQHNDLKTNINKRLNLKPAALFCKIFICVTNIYRGNAFIHSREKVSQPCCKTPSAQS